MPGISAVGFGSAGVAHVVNGGFASRLTPSGKLWSSPGRSVAAAHSPAQIERIGSATVLQIQRVFTSGAASGPDGAQLGRALVWEAEASLVAVFSR
jgi:hypothetical protein